MCAFCSLSNEPVARTQTAATAAMGEKNYSDGIFRNRQFAFQSDGVAGYRDRLSHEYSPAFGTWSLALFVHQLCRVCMPR